jgi:hypothetical protein
MLTYFAKMTVTIAMSLRVCQLTAYRTMAFCDFFSVRANIRACELFFVYSCGTSYINRLN